jgi:hypothetical protein
LGVLKLRKNIKPPTVRVQLNSFCVQSTKSFDYAHFYCILLGGTGESEYIPMLSQLPHHEDIQGYGSRLIADKILNINLQIRSYRKFAASPEFFN